jgi:hypothetical protein
MLMVILWAVIYRKLHILHIRAVTKGLHNVHLLLVLGILR